MPIHPKMSFAEYRQLPGVNISSLLEVDPSPKNYLHELAQPSNSSSAMRLGSAAHTAVLEPMEFLRGYVLQPDEFPDGKGVMKRTSGALKSVKEWRAEQAEKGKQWVSSGEYATAVKIAEEVKAHPEAKKILAEGDPEVTITWDDPVTGMLCKARLDWVRDDCFADLKTSRHPKPNDFARAAANLKYHVRMAWYQWGLSVVRGTHEMFATPAKIIHVQNDGCHDVVVFNLPYEALREGQRVFRPLLDRLKVCTETDTWPGVASEELNLELPRWVFTDPDENEAEEMNLAAL